jgi:hypothetical protein
VGAEFLAAAGGSGVGGGGYYYEVEVLEARGFFYAGFAGTNIGPKFDGVGNDACSWSVNMGDGEGLHGCGRGGVGARGSLLGARRSLQGERVGVGGGRGGCWRVA